MTTREIINKGTTANDGTGDTLRTAAGKINNNFGQLFFAIGGDSASFSAKTLVRDAGIIFEGASANDFETTLTVTNPTQDNTITLPDSSGTVVLTATVDTLYNKTLSSPVITTPQINDTSANHQYIVAVSELAADRTITLPLLAGNDEITFNGHTQTLTNKTLGNPLLKSPRVGGKLLDSAGAEILELTKATSAVNYIEVTNSATGAGPSITATGDDANVNLEIKTKGTGAISFENKIALEKGTDVTTTTAIDLTDPLTIFNPTSTQIDPTIAAGSITGEVKSIMNVGTQSVHLYGATSGILKDADSNNGFLVILPGDGCQLVYVSSESKWFILGNNGVTGA
jgi:hypothetical protein